MLTMNKKMPQEPESRNMKEKGQSVLEYALIIAVIVSALMAMNVYVQRSVQSNLKTLEDQINANP